MFTFAPSDHTYAWGGLGHRTVAGLAFDQLKNADIPPQAQDKHLIADGLKMKAPEARSLVMAAATWPDFIKNDRDSG